MFSNHFVLVSGLGHNWPSGWAQTLMEFFHVDVGKEDHSDKDETEESFFHFLLLSLSLTLSLFFSLAL